MIKASLLWQVGLIANVKLHFLWQTCLPVMMLLRRRVTVDIVTSEHIRAQPVSYLVYLLFHEKWPIGIKRGDYMGYPSWSVYFRKVSVHFRYTLIMTAH